MTSAVDSTNVAMTTKVFVELPQRFSSFQLIHAAGDLKA
jgi:hypothetical protein